MSSMQEGGNGYPLEGGEQKCSLYTVYVPVEYGKYQVIVINFFGGYVVFCLQRN